MWRSRGFWFGLLLSSLFLIFFFKGSPAVELWRSLARANYLYIVPAALSFWGALWWRAVRWHFMLSPLGNISSRRLMAPIIVGFAVNNLLPGRIGWLARAYLVGEREGINKVSSGSSIIAVQVFDGLTLLLIVMVIALTIPLSGWALQVSRVLIATYSLFMFLFFFAAFNPGLMRRLGNLLSRLLPLRWQEQVRGWFDSALAGVAAVRSLPKLTIILLTSLLVWAFESGVFIFLALAFQLNLPLHSLLLVTAIAYLSLLLPSLPGGIGPFEYFGKQTLLVLGINQSLAIVFMSVVHLVLLIPVTLVGLIYLWLERQTLTRVTRRQVQ